MFLRLEYTHQAVPFLPLSRPRTSGKNGNKQIAGCAEDSHPRGECVLPGAQKERLTGEPVSLAVCEKGNASWFASYFFGFGAAAGFFSAATGCFAVLCGESSVSASFALNG